MKKTTLFLMMTLCLVMTACVAFADNGGWIKEEDHLCYYRDGVKVTGQQTISLNIDPNVITIGGVVYYFTDDGNLMGNVKVQQVGQERCFVDGNNCLAYGWQTIDGLKYYFIPETGYAPKDTIYEIDGVKYVFKDGHAVINDWNDVYYGNSEGAALIGYQKIGDFNYFFEDDGKSHFGFQQIDGNTHYFAPAEVFGWIKDDGKWYHFDETTGIMSTGMIVLNGETYSFNDDGSLILSQNCIIVKDSQVYGISPEGYYLKGWQTIGENQYCFKDPYYGNDYSAYTGMVQLNENGYTSVYLFAEDGKLQKNVWYTDENNNRMYFGEDGKRARGWFKVGEDTYLYNQVLYTGIKQLDDGNIYFFSEEGKLMTNYLYTTENGAVYYFDSEGKAAKGWQTVGGDTYYFRPAAVTGVTAFDEYDKLGYYYFSREGKQQKNAWYVAEDGKKYYYGADGRQVYGWQTIGNDRYFFNDQTVESEESDNRMQLTLADMWNQSSIILIGTGESEPNHLMIKGAYCLTGDQIIQGTKYHFDQDGKLDQSQDTPDPESQNDIPMSEITAGGIKYSLDNEKNTATVTGADKDLGEAKIPATLKVFKRTYKVIKIGAKSFKGHKSLTTAEIGKNVKEIGDNAFSGCAKLETVKGGTGLTVIGNGAFQKCTSLMSVTITSKVTRIGKNAFSGCKKLSEIIIKTKKLTADNIGSNAFKNVDSKATVKCPNSKLAKTYRTILLKKGMKKTVTFK